MRYKHREFAMEFAKHKFLTIEIHHDLYTLKKK